MRHRGVYDIALTIGFVLIATGFSPNRALRAANQQIVCVASTTWGKLRGNKSRSPFLLACARVAQIEHATVSEIASPEKRVLPSGRAQAFGSLPPYFARNFVESV